MVKDLDFGVLVTSLCKPKLLTCICSQIFHNDFRSEEEVMISGRFPLF